MNKKLAKRPLDPKRQLPVPFVQAIMPDGLADFRSIEATKVIEAARASLCGLCGKGLGLYAAFLGGPKSAANGTYGDPPMHEACADDATRLCPHIARPRVQRREASDTAVTPDGFVEEKPPGWVMVITKHWNMEMTRQPGGVVPVFVVTSVARTRQYEYDGDVLVEVS